MLKPLHTLVQAPADDETNLNYLVISADVASKKYLSSRLAIRRVTCEEKASLKNSVY